MNNSGIFVTGTDTDVGKTFVSIALVHLFSQSRKVQYWKPLATGKNTDTQRVRRSCKSVVNSVYEFSDPVSPIVASKRANVTIDADRLHKKWRAITRSHTFSIIEGIGGVLVPLSDSYLLIDFIQFTGLPAIVVAPNRVGAINHVLLSVRALSSHKIPVAAIILNQTVRDFGNKKVINDMTGIQVLELPQARRPIDVISSLSLIDGLRVCA